MPVYEYNCKTCEDKFVKVCSVAQHERNPPCDKCQGVDTAQIFSPPHFSVEYFERQDYSENFGEEHRYISNKREFNEVLNKKGLVEVGPEGRLAAKKRMEARRQEKADTGTHS